jgi:hypothetical protein
LAEDEEAGGFWLAGGHYLDDSVNLPLADLFLDTLRSGDNIISVGWLVLS